MSNETEEYLKEKLSIWAHETCWDSEGEVSSVIASTNSIFMDQYCDDVSLEYVDDETYEFICLVTLSGEPRKDDVFFCGDTIHVTIAGVILYDEDENDWVVGEHYEVGASVEDWGDIDDEGIYSETEINNDDVYDPSSSYKNADTLICVLSELSAKSWFRGHADHEWELKPSIARQTSPSLELEKQLRLEFENQTTFLAPNLHPLGIAKCNFLMQHHGLPTRLLDWTTSPLVALYFSVANPKHDDKNACIWVMDPSQLNRIHRKSYPYEVNASSEDIFNKKSREVLAIHAPYTDLRMKMQRSEFTVHTHYDAIEKDISATVFLKELLIIDKKIKIELREKLRVFGIDLSFLFPDMDNIAKNVASNIIE